MQQKETVMICPKCGRPMTLGKLNIYSGGTYPSYGLAPYWAEKDYFIRTTFPNARDAEKRGVGIRFPQPREKIDIAYTNLPDGYACKECRVILLDCNA
ncbi:MAG: hypothetical protein IJ055_01385 [Oscillospiraceae bacterium]|nr:hypothetical protein [Oscillospiraceae bacterium]